MTRSKTFTLFALALTLAACGRQRGAVLIDSRSVATAADAQETACTSTPPEGVRVTQSRPFPDFDARLTPADASMIPSYGGAAALGKARELKMLPIEKADCTETLFGIFDDPNGSVATPAWLIIVHTTKPWTMDVAHYWTECTRRAITCPTPTQTSGSTAYQSIVVLDAVSGGFIRQMEGPQEA